MDSGTTANKAYGAHITNVIYGNVTDLAGLVIDDVTDGINNSAIKTGLGKVEFGDVFFPVQKTTASAPTYVKGGMYFDTTLNKLRIGGATAWETVTST